MRARFAMGIVSSIFLWLAPPPRGERVASCGDSIKCTNENGWRYFRACGMERNVHWWRYDFESLAYPAMAALGPHARRILVLGGASGGVASRFLQSSDVEEVRWVSNLNGVMEAARRCVPSVSGIDEDPRLRVEMLNSTQFLYQNPANKAVMQYDIIVQDTLSLFAEEHGLGRHFWSASLETEYFSSSRLEVLQKMLSSRGVLVLTAGYLTTPKFLQIAQGALSTFHNRWTLQFAAPDVAHATGVTIGFVAGGIEATMKMNRSWWQLQGIETCFYTEDMHRALLTPSLTLLKVLGLTVSSEPSSSLPKMAAAELPQVSRQTCGYEDQEFQLLETERTNFQTVQVTRALSFAGDSECVTLFLDGELQLTDVYGDVYHEALVHVMMASLGPSPLRKVLVLGGGDGGVATVALKYPMVELLQVEIDERVIQMSKRFFPHFSAAFTDQRHKLVVGDAVRWVEDHAHEMQSTFDLCIIDSTDEPLATGSLVMKGRGINALAVRPDLRLVAAARWDRRVELFDGKTAKSLNRLVCHDDAVLSVAFEREKGSFATGGADGRIAIWSLFCESYLGPIQSQGEENLEPGDLPGAKVHRVVFVVSVLEMSAPEGH
ncbi:unnamed protein product [Durusdinium trenchii]|uniref:PABS domain-containing protein n=1 Tax=Durusdinium trenchii TaxID=1381693 RepID=A0ABP0JEC4_9DINO